MLLKRLLEREYGIRTDMIVNPLVSVVGTIPVQILGNNPNRLAWTVINLSGNDLFLGFDMQVGPTKGIMISSGGGGVNWKWQEEFEAVGYAVWAVATAPNSPIYVLELVATGEIT